MRVFIAEKPSLAKAIFEGLGGNPNTEKKNGYFQHGADVVTWCVGHMLEIFDPEDYDPKLKNWRFSDLPIKTTCPPRYKIKPETAAQTHIILTLIEQASSIVHAGDPDEEGCLLVDELLWYAENTKPVQRLLVSDLNLAPVQKQLANMQPNENFQGMTRSALSRSLVDKGFGYNLTRGCTLKGQEKGYEGVLRVGRVQSAALGLINQRTLANQDHAECFYYDIFAPLTINGLQIKAKYQPVESDQVDDKKRLISEAQARHIAERISGKEATVTVATTKPENTAPPLPLDLATLQIICAERFGYKAKETLAIMQELYETHKLLTYPRTNNRYLSDEHYYQASDIAAAVTATIPELATVVAGMDKERKHKAFDASKMEAHHAIVPTTKSGAGIQLSAKEKNVYGVAATYYIGLFWSDAVRNLTKIHIDIKGDTFTATQSVTVNKGWEVIGKDIVDGEQDESNADSGKTTVDLSVLKFSDKGECAAGEVDKKPVKPPKYFTESTLIAAMKNPGKYVSDPELRKALKDKEGGGTLGTEATRAGILDKLAANTGLIRIEKEKGYSQPVWKTTKQGQEFCSALPKEIITPDISAIWAESQARIKAGELTVEAFVQETDAYIRERIEDLDKNGLNISGHTCPDCGKPMRKITGSNGDFWACTGYRSDPQCKKTLPDFNGEPDYDGKGKAAADAKKAKEEKATTCPKCKKRLKRLKDKKTEGAFFWACEGVFDNSCKTFFPDNNGKPDLKPAAKKKVSAKS